METVLAIDTCTEACSVSLYHQGQKKSKLINDVEKSSGLILSLCDQVFCQSGLTTAQLDTIVYTQGPGSFTGVRMCISVVQGIALAHNIATIGFSTLEVIGFGAAKQYNTDKIAIAIDARMSEVYWGVYSQHTLINETLKKPNEVDSLDKSFIGVGTGWGTYKNELLQKTGIKKCIPMFYPNAEDLIDLYLKQTDKSQYISNKLPLPTYLRNRVTQKSLK